MKIIYQEAYMIHGDLGEFNIIIDEEGNILIIDWVQWISRNHPNAEMMLRRDIENVCNYFDKKFHVESDVEDILSEFHKKGKKKRFLLF
jgi:RIO kinase 2